MLEASVLGVRCVVQPEYTSGRLYRDMLAEGNARKGKGKGERGKGEVKVEFRNLWAAKSSTHYVLWPGVTPLRKVRGEERGKL